MIFGASGGYAIHACESSSVSGKDLPLTLDAPVLTDHENMDSTCREELPKTVTFCEDLGHWWLYRWLWVEPVNHTGSDGVHYHSPAELPRGPQSQRGNMGVGLTRARIFISWVFTPNVHNLKTDYENFWRIWRRLQSFSPNGWQRFPAQVLIVEPFCERTKLPKNPQEYPQEKTNILRLLDRSCQFLHGPEAFGTTWSSDKF